MHNIAWKVSKNGVFPGPYFPTFGMNKDRYRVSHRMQSECGKIRTRKNSVFAHFSRSVIHSLHLATLSLQYLIIAKTNWTSNHFPNILRHFDVCQTSLSPQVKRWEVITYKYGIYELPHELPNDLRIRISGNQEK